MNGKLLVLTLLTVTGFLATPNARIAAQTGVQQVVSSQGGDDEETCLWCHEDCQEGYHYAHNLPGWDLSLIWHFGAGRHLTPTCWPGSCEDKHGPNTCGGDALAVLELGAIRKAIDAHDMVVLGKMTAAYPASMVINKGRSAIQLLDCKGGVVAHLPVRSSEAELLNQVRLMAVMISPRKQNTPSMEKAGGVFVSAERLLESAPKIYGAMLF